MSLQIDDQKSHTQEAKDDKKSSFFSSGSASRSYFKSLFDDERASTQNQICKLGAQKASPAISFPDMAPGINSDETVSKAARFLTHSIVGAPHSILLGRRSSLELNPDTGMLIDMKTGLLGFPDSWSDCWVLSHALDRPGQIRAYPSRFRMYLERRALVIAVFGIALSIASILAHLYLR